MTNAMLQQYQDMKIQSASPAELLLITYDGALKAMRRARRACGKGEGTKARVELMTALSAVLELESTLNVEAGGEVAVSLRKLYMYVMELLAKSVTNLALEPLDESIRIISELHGTWKQALGVA